MVLSSIYLIEVNRKTGRRLDKRSVSDKMLMEAVLPIKLVGVLVFLFHLRTHQINSDSEFYVHLHVLKGLTRFAITIDRQPEFDSVINVRLLSIAEGEHEKPTLVNV